MNTAADRPGPDTTTDLYVEWVHDETGFESLRSAWNALADSIPTHSVFLRHEWFDAAWQWRKRDCTLALACVRRAGSLVGVGPFVRTRRRRHNLPVRCLEFLSVPDTQFCDILVAPDQPGAIAAALVDALARVRPRWDVIDLGRLAADSSAREFLPARLGACGLTYRVRANDVNLYIDLAESWQQFYAGRSRRLKKANNLIANRLQRAVQAIDIERIPGTDESIDSLAAAAEAAVALSAHSWKKRTGVSLDQPGPGAFFRRLVEHARNNGWLTIWLLRLDRTAAAMELQIAYRGHVHALRADFAEAFKPHSPGTYLNWKLLQALFDRDLTRYWFGPGENSYKLHWTEIGEPLYALQSYNNTLRGRWLALYETRMRPWLKRLLRREEAKAPQAEPEST